MAGGGRVTCSKGHRCCDDQSKFHDHFLSAEDCTQCAATGDPLVASVDDECPTCGAYMLNPELHANWHRDIARRADSYVSPPTYGGYR